MTVSHDNTQPAPLDLPMCRQLADLVSEHAINEGINVVQLISFTGTDSHP